MAKACKSNGTLVVAILWEFSGGRVSNEWVTYLVHRDNGAPQGALAKVPVIPDDIQGSHGSWLKDGDRKAYWREIGPFPISLLVG